MEPPGVERRMDHNETGITVPQALYRGCSAMRRAMVDEPEQPCADTVRFLCQPVVDQAATGCNPGRRGTAAPPIPSMDIPGGERWPSPTALVFVLDRGRSARPRRQRGMTAEAGLQAGLLVGPEASVLGAKALAWPLASIEVQHQASLLGQAGIAWQDPVRVPPGFESLLIPN